MGENHRRETNVLEIGSQLMLHILGHFTVINHVLNPARFRLASLFGRTLVMLWRRELMKIRDGAGDRALESDRTAWRQRRRQIPVGGTGQNGQMVSAVPLEAMRR
jgi:hypothetical protein